MTTITSLKEKHASLFHIFEQEFLKICEQLDPPVQKKLLSLAPELFRHWLVSALIPETTLTPAVAFQIDFLQNFSEDTLHYYTLSVDQSKPFSDMFSYSTLTASVEQHPILDDIVFLLDYCTPDGTMTKQYTFLPEDQDFLLSHLSRQEPFYIEYLTLLLWELELLVMVPAIHTIKVQPSQNSAAFLEKTPKEQLLLLLESVLHLTELKFTDALSADPGYFTTDFFRNFLVSGVDTEDIFIALYDMVDIDITQLWNDTDPEHFSEEESSIASSFFLIGILLDKWFLTPLGHFLQLLQTTYYLPFSFLPTLNRLSNFIAADCDLDTELFSPCSIYDLSSLGEALLGEQGKKTPLPVHVHFPQLVDAVFRQGVLPWEEDFLLLQDPTLEVYGFHICVIQEPDQWKRMEFLESVTLQELCHELAMVFENGAPTKYTITLPTPTGDIIYKVKQYIPLQPMPAECKTFSFAVGKTFFLTLETDTPKRLQVTCMEKKKQRPFLLYPRLQQQSDAMSQAERKKYSF